MYKRPLRSNDIYHSSRQNHKYIKKIGDGEDAKYFYTQDELIAYYDSLKSDRNSELINSPKIKEDKKELPNKSQITTDTNSGTEKEKSKSGGGGGKGKKGGKGRKGGKDSDSGGEKVNLFTLPIKEMSDSQLEKWLEKNPKMAKTLFKELGFSTKSSIKDLKKLLFDDGYRSENETIYSALKNFGFIGNPSSSKNKKKQVKHSDLFSYPNKNQYCRSIRSNELYHWGFRSRKPKYIAKIGNGKNARYFYTKEELDAYKRMTNDIQKEGSKTFLQKTKDFVDYRVTGSGYKRDIKKFNKDMDNIEKIRSKESRKKEMDQKVKDHNQRVISIAKENKRQEKEQEFRDKSLVGKVVKLKEDMDSRKKDRLDSKTTTFMKENPSYSEAWMKDLNISKREYNPEKDSDSNKLKKVLEKKELLRKDETLNEFLERYGYVTKGKGDKLIYHKKKQVKHSDVSDEFYSMSIGSEELYHHGVRGMKWYQHIFGPVQEGAKYNKDKKGKYEKDDKKSDKGTNSKGSNNKGESHESLAAKKAELINKGNASEIYKNRELFTDSELIRANNRITEINKLKQKAAEEFVNDKKSITANDMIKTLSTTANNAESIYNAVTKLNRIANESMKQLPSYKAKELAKKEDKRIKEEERIKPIKDMDLKTILKNPGDYNTTELQDLVNRMVANHKLSEMEAGTYDYSKNNGGKKGSRK